MEFSDIALSQLLTSAPELGGLITSFQDLTDELPEDSGINVGVFTVVSGDTYYVPVVAKDGTMSPADSIMSASTGKFLPLTKQTISDLLANTSAVQGTVTRIPKELNQNPSLQGLIQPPRTGKFAYASSSRLTEFLGALPNQLKTSLMEKLAAEQSVMKGLGNLFGYKDMYEPLSVLTKEASIQVVEPEVRIITEHEEGLSPEAIKDILQKGYFVTGDHLTPRLAFSTDSFNKEGTVQEVSEVSGNRDYRLVLDNGDDLEAFMPRMSKFTPITVALFIDGRYATGSKFVSVGDPLDRKEVLRSLFQWSPPSVLRSVEMDDSFMVIANSGEFIGPFTATKVVLNHLGVEISVSSPKGSVSKICGYDNFKGNEQLHDKILYVSRSVPVLRLSEDVSFNICRSAIEAYTKRSMRPASLLGDELAINFDGVEFTSGGKVVGGVPEAMSFLVIKNQLPVAQAESMIKQAKETKRAKVYLTKQAFSTEFSTGNIPSYGVPARDIPEIGPNNGFKMDSVVPSVQQAMPLNDGQVMESVILSELLQSPDLFEKIDEYLPTIEEAIDKLGRLLLISRVKISDLSRVTDTETVFAFLSQLRTVYKLLGDNLNKLRKLAAVSRASVDGASEA